MISKRNSGVASESTESKMNLSCDFWKRYNENINLETNLTIIEKAYRS